MEDIVGDYADKTVTLEDFPFYSAGVKMASVHPCKHASVMKTLLDRADAALKIRLQKLKRGNAGVGGNNGGKVESGMEGLVDELSKAQIAERRGQAAGVAAAGGAGGDEWEVLNEGGMEEDEVAIRVDQYLVVFLKVGVYSLFLACLLFPLSPTILLVSRHFPFSYPAWMFVLLDTDAAVVHGERYPWHRARFHDGRLRQSCNNSTDFWGLDYSVVGCYYLTAWSCIPFAAFPPGQPILFQEANRNAKMSHPAGMYGKCPCSSSNSTVGMEPFFHYRCGRCVLYTNLWKVIFLFSITYFLDLAILSIRFEAFVRSFVVVSA